MDWDRIQTHWPELQEQVRERWVLLNEDDLALIAGKRDRLLSMLEEVYGLERDDAEGSVEDFCAKCEAEHPEIFRA
jgi:uncharacterized protein YjbJ (UPF0337 family)